MKTADEKLLSQAEVDSVVNEWITNMVSECNVPIARSVKNETEFLLRPEGLGLGGNSLDSSALTPAELALKKQLRPQQRKRKAQEVEMRIEDQNTEEATKGGSKKIKKRKIVHKNLKT